MTREDMIARISACCTVLELGRLRRVAKVAYEESQNQQRALAFGQAQPSAMPAEIDPGWATADTDTANPAQVGAEPQVRIFSPANTQTPDIW